MNQSAGSTLARTAARVAELLQQASRLAVLTGAGMSAESGVPTFRDALTGLWAQFSPEELATPEAFRRDPARVFGWYLQRWRMVRKVEPHEGHLGLATLQSQVPELRVITQNVDRLHQRAGVLDVIELHGALGAFRCWDQGHPYVADNLEGMAVDGSVPPPECPECGSIIRPGVVWFGEMLPADAVSRATRAVTECDVLLVIGTSAQVHPAAELPSTAHAAGARIVEINPEQTPVTRMADIAWPETAGVAVPQVVRSMTVGEVP